MTSPASAPGFNVPREIKEITVGDYYTQWWTRKGAPLHNALWDGRSFLALIEKLSNGHYRLTLSNGEVKVVVPEIVLWLEVYSTCEVQR